jgi:hypothetical protein
VRWRASTLHSRHCMPGVLSDVMASGTVAKGKKSMAAHDDDAEQAARKAAKKAKKAARRDASSESEEERAARKAAKKAKKAAKRVAASSESSDTDEPIKVVAEKDKGAVGSETTLKQARRRHGTLSPSRFTAVRPTTYKPDSFPSRKERSDTWSSSRFTAVRSTPSQPESLSPADPSTALALRQRCPQTNPRFSHCGTLTSLR